MSFVEKYVQSLNASNLLDDDRHFATEALAAAALADRHGAGLGALLCRVKYADGTLNKVFEGNSANLAQLLRIWTAAVTEKGRSRGWVKAHTAWDMQAAFSLYRRVAERSLEYWLDGKCGACNGTRIAARHTSCPVCKGSGTAEITGGGFEREKILDMVSELEGLVQAHGARAAARMRRSA
ncbi:hypothetical protein [Janthinobacterium agaricidamnosum]|nr:hypothetical protein [Janthinobacterium agaricidamnosum]